MKSLIAALSLCLLLGCSTGANSESGRLSDLVMPVAEHPELSVVEVVLAIDDVKNRPASVPDIVVQTLDEAGVLGAINFTYTWGDPDGFLLIDANLLRYTTPEAASAAMLRQAEGTEAIKGIGDAAIISGDEWIAFTVGTERVTLTVIQDEVDVRSVAEAYANWLSVQ